MPTMNRTLILLSLLIGTAAHAALPGEPGFLVGVPPQMKGETDGAYLKRLDVERKAGERKYQPPPIGADDYDRTWIQLRRWYEDNERRALEND